MCSNCYIAHVPKAPSWYLLIHQLPPRPLYLRAKIGNRLTKVGALALKNSVYVLPGRSDCLEDFLWIAQEAAAGGGEAHVCEAEFRDPGTQGGLLRRFREQTDAAYEALAAEIRAAIAVRKRRSGPEEPAGSLVRLRRRLEEAREIDFFGTPKREEVEQVMRTLEDLLHEDEPAPRRGLPGLSARVWVTRRSIKVDRMATAWLVRRRLNPRARFRFVDPANAVRRSGEIRFDMTGGDVTHEADRCTFETLLARTGAKDPALRAIAEIVHDLDLKDGKFGRPEAAGIRVVIDGIVRSQAADTKRLEAGLDLFDSLYAALSETPHRRGRLPGAAGGTARKR
jgi:hypothetical protein